MEKLDREKLEELYRRMVCIRAFEKEAIELAKRNLTRAAVHTYNGEEAIAVGICAHLTEKDQILSTHRGHGHCIAKGADPRRMFAELMARSTGYCKGKGGSMHIADTSIGMLGANGIVGGGIPIACGAGLALKYQGEGNVAVCFFGDGASNEGTFHESLNMAAVRDLPVIFVCENNQYAISLHVSASTGCENIADRASGYGIEGYTIDGNNVVEVYEKMGAIIEQVRTQSRPVLVEMKTYRMAGHYFGDNENYREKSEVIAWEKKDPIVYCRDILMDTYLVAPEELDAVEKEEKERILEASEIAKGDPEPKPADLVNDLYDDTMKEIVWKPFVAQNSKEGVK